MGIFYTKSKNFDVKMSIRTLIIRGVNLELPFCSRKYRETGCVAFRRQRVKLKIMYFSFLLNQYFLKTNKFLLTAMVAQVPPLEDQTSPNKKNEEFIRGPCTTVKVIS